MAIYHLSAKPVQRSKGHSATAGSAYRAGDYIKDERTGEIHDYRKKAGVLYSEIITPTGEKIERAELWNLAEKAEKRKDGTTAREYEISLPSELNEDERKSLALEFTKYLVEKNKCVADVSLHEPSRNGDERNFHAHILCTTRIFENGQLTKKCNVELSDTDRKKKGLDGRKTELEKIRIAWAEMANNALEKANSKERIDERTLKAQGIERTPTQHMGKNATAILRKGQIPRRTREKEVRSNDEQVADRERHIHREDELKNSFKENHAQGVDVIKARFEAYKEQEKVKTLAEQERREREHQAELERRAELEKQRQQEIKRERQVQTEQEKKLPKRKSMGMER